MEALLSLSFDNISSRNVNKIRKGLRQIEGLLAQICLSAPSSHEPTTEIPPTQHVADDASLPLDLLMTDPAFLEFHRLQESFEWNVATRLTETLERLLGFQSSPQTEDLILSTLTILQGILLLHPPSRTLFSREVHLNLLLDLLDPTRNDSQTLCAALLVMVTSLLDRPNNARLFEASDGLRTVCSLFQSKAPSVTQDVRMKAMEFFYFYLMPETPSLKEGGELGMQRSTSTFSDTGGGVALPKPIAPTPPVSRNTSSESAPSVQYTPTRSHSYQSKISASVNTLNSDGSGRSWSSHGSEISVTRTMEEKQKLLSAFLGNVDDLVQDLREGGTVFIE